MTPSGKVASDTAQDLAAFVRLRRTANRMTQAELAALAGVGVRFISDLEQGKQTLRYETINLVLRVFGKRLGVVDVDRDGHV